MSEAPTPTPVPAVHDQTEPQHISTSLEVETLDNNLFRSKSLHVPTQARGVFGGQVISQALVCATRCVEPAYYLNSMHCYFLLSASPIVPIIYNVDRKGKTVFIMLCSFQRPESWQPHNYQMPMPPNVPAPEQCQDTQIVYSRYLERPDVKPEVREFLEEFVKERLQSPLCIRHAHIRVLADGGKTVMTWFKVRNMSNYTPGFQKCILSYISDSNFIGAAAKVLDVDRFQKGDKHLSMTSTLDHSIWFYDNDFDCGDWILYVVDTPRARLGRAVVIGRMYTANGKLIAVTSQEGVMRVDVPGPDVPKLMSKL
ncbi:hypothetical protein EUX98_g1855 [Antrodiella citrinella]|uniref:Acyl-CoA thioesterase II domain-containing protein n=1 Tax=Antrodiella citrinella TaxID=2447956 RepID=A0A4S4N0G2_9APHY|nr:hypothetical protein EUX98_g1855 [Antrodiella citrinella]